MSDDYREEFDSIFGFILDDCGIDQCKGDVECMSLLRAEISRLRADVERLRGALAAVLEKAKWMRDFSSQSHQIQAWDLVAGASFESLGKPSLAELSRLTAALADTADKPNEGGG